MSLSAASSANARSKDNRKLQVNTNMQGCTGIKGRSPEELLTLLPNITCFLRRKDDSTIARSVSKTAEKQGHMLAKRELSLNRERAGATRVVLANAYIMRLQETQHMQTSQLLVSATT
eukprot:8502898-Pyramimonas_sp.AAC.1